MNLETLLVQLSPKEAVVTAGGGDAAAAELDNFNRVLQRMNLLVTERKKAEFTIKDLPQDLTRILKRGKAKGKKSRDRWEFIINIGRHNTRKERRTGGRQKRRKILIRVYKIYHFHFSRQGFR